MEKEIKRKLVVRPTDFHGKIAFEEKFNYIGLRYIFIHNANQR